MTVNTSEEKVVLTAVDQFSAVFKTAQRSVEGMKQSLDAVKGGLAAIGVTVGAGAILNMYYDTLKATAALDDMAESTGASVETLSAIQRVAKVAGADFDGLAGQIGKMIKGLKQGGEEGGKSAAAFAFLDIKTKDVNGRFRDTGEIVIELAQKLSKYEDGGNKVALVQDALGKGAERYLPLLKDIAEGTDLHATVTAKQAAQAELAEKNIARLKLVMEDSRKELVNQYTPAIVEFTEKLLAATKASGGLIGGLATMSRAQTENPGARLQEIDKQLELINKGKTEPRTLQFGTGASESLLKQEREYLQAVQRQQALALAGEGSLDARDLRAREQPKTNNYQSPDTKKSSQRLSPYDSAELEMRQAISKAKLGSDSEAYSTQLAIEAGKYGELNEAQKTRLIQLAAEKDLQREDAKLKQEVSQIVEAQGEKDLRAAEAHRAQLDQLRASTMDAVDVENEAYKRRLESLQQFTDAELAANGGAKAIAEQMESDHMQRLLEIDRNKHQAQRNMEMTTAQLGAELLQQFAGKSKAAALAVIAINKALAIAQVIVNTQAAVARGYAELGVYGGTANAAYMEGLMAVQIGLIAATGLVEASNVGGGGASRGSPPNPVSTTGGASASSTLASGGQQGTAQSRTTIIRLEPGGDRFSRQQVRDLLKQLDEEQRDGGRVVVVG
jgi:hypothetical protein